MENASKALLIAGGVLIAMIIASFGVYLYGVYHSHAENVMNKLTESQITEFNAKFTAFEGRDLTTNEVISVMNLVKENNTNSYNYNNIIEINDSECKWTVGTKTYDINSTLTKNSNDYEKICNKLLVNFIGTTYRMEISKYSDGLVSNIIIHKE